MLLVYSIQIQSWEAHIAGGLGDVWQCVGCVVRVEPNVDKSSPFNGTIREHHVGPSTISKQDSLERIALIEFYIVIENSINVLTSLFILLNGLTW